MPFLPPNQQCQSTEGTYGMLNAALSNLKENYPQIEVLKTTDPNFCSFSTTTVTAKHILPKKLPTQHLTFL